MNKIKCLLVAGAVTVAAVAAKAQTVTPEIEKRAADIVAKMTLEEKVSYLSGATSFSLREIPRVGIPTVLLADGPVGIRNHAPHSTLYPASMLSAATWNRDLLYRLGRSLGDDARARGVGILLGPGVNIYRSPLCGRNYEYFGEDPYLTGEAALAYINGVQSRGVLATIKHFAGNNQEWSRHHVSSEIDERTLFEIYFPAFQKAVTKGKVGSVMDSYNLLNGVHSTENAWLNKEVLRKRWGFDGIIMSDWTSVYSTIAAANNGLDLEMPKGKNFTVDKIRAAIEAGTVDERVIDEKVKHILQTVIAFGIFDRKQKEEDIPLDNPSSHETALALAREGIVMLKNDGGVLPLRGSIALVGPNATVITTGGGSGNVVPFTSTPVSEALKKMNKKTIMLTDDVIYDDIADQVFTDSTMTKKGFRGEYFKNKGLKGAADVVRIDPKVDFDWEYGRPMDGFPTDTFSVRWSGCYTPKADETLKIYIGGDDGYRIKVNGKTVAGDWGNHAYSFRELALKVKGGVRNDIVVEYFDNISSANIKVSLKKLNEEKLMKGVRKADNVVYCAGFNSSIEGEGFDRPFELPQFQQEMIARLAAENPNMVVVVNAGGGIAFKPWLDKVKGVLMAWYPGQEGGQAIAEILRGKLSPSGKLPISIEERLEDNPCHENYHENMQGRELRSVEYREGVFMGYRGYDKTGVKPLFPFGFGLSYSTFEYSGLTLEKTGNNEVKVAFNVKNTGRVEAKEAAQVYVTDVKSTVKRPLKELKGFEKVTLKPGETKRVELTLDKDAFAYYDVMQERFVVEPGTFTISVGGSSANLPLKQDIEL